MDVLRRHRLLVASGLTVALALALLSYVRVTTSGLVYREPETWSNEATLALSQSSFPEWRSVAPPFAQPERFAGLVDLYAAFATSDPVIAALKKRGLVEPGAADRGAASITATAVPSTLNGAPTPLLKITAGAASPAQATRLIRGATDAFIDVLRSRQNAAGIPENRRVELRIVKGSAEPTLVTPRSKTTAIVIFLAGLTAAIAVAFIRDNLKRAPHRQADELEAAPALDPLRGPTEVAVPGGSDGPRAVRERPSDWERFETAGESEAMRDQSATSSR